MHNNTNSGSSSVAGFSVLALFAVAIIAGQAHGDLGAPTSINSNLPTAFDLGVLMESDSTLGFDVGHDAIRKFRTTPLVVDFSVEMLNLKYNEPKPTTGPGTSF